MRTTRRLGYSGRPLADTPTAVTRFLRRSLSVSLLCLLLGLTAAAPVAAWSVLGHRLVGELAERRLTPAARAEVERLLAGESDPTLGGVASWADALRATDPERFKRTSRWHYVNFPAGGCDYRPERDCPNGDCVIAQIRRQRDLLADRSQPLEARRDALKFLVHFVGDVHQPLHAGNWPDKGGNGYQISLRTDLPPEEYARKRYVDGVMGTNLHSVWDYYVLGSRGLDAEAYADALAAAPPLRPAATRLDPADWARESCRLLDAQALYPPGHKLDHRYLDAQRPLAERQVRLAGERLAALLNGALDPARR